MEKLALFDFCGTIANYQTLGPYLEYVLRHESPHKYQILCNSISKSFFRIIERIINYVGIDCFLYKSLLIYQLKNISYSLLDKYGTEYYQQIVKENLICETIGLIHSLRESGYEIVIVSGGSGFYIKDFAAEYGIKHLITAEFEFSSDKCTGHLSSECMFEEKKWRVEAFIRQQDKPCSCEIACSDSFSDMPMLELCRKKIVISHRKHQQWVKEDMEEIIWT